MFTEVDRYKLTDEGMILRALPARSPKVTVTDAYLKPLRGAKVSVTAAYGLKSVHSPGGVTNSAGEVRIPAVYPGGKYTFRATLLGYSPRETRSPEVGSKNWIDLIEIVTEPATKVVKGKVVDANGKPVSGAEVTTDFGPYALTDTKGEFTLKQMPDSLVPLTAGKGSLKGTNLDAKGQLSRAHEPVIVIH